MKVLVVGAVLAVLAVGCTRNITRVRELHVPEGSTDTRDHDIHPRERQTRVLPLAAVRVDDDFPGGAFTSVADASGGVEIVITPENRPINDSAWFAFRLASTSGAHDVTVTLRYEGGTHRYLPKISHDGEHFTSLAPDALTVTSDKTRATFTLPVTQAPLWVAGQELLTLDQLQPWLAAVSAHPFVKRTTIGKSVAGRDLDALTVSEATGERAYLIVIGRQHPPEVTGTLALMSFVDALCADSERARAFRRRYETIVIPMINPDGVADGHWRHNLHGIDLNRDWEFFRQPETRVARDELLRLQGKRVAFAIDFHSTFKDVFYVLPDAIEPSSRVLSARWIAALAARLPSYAYRVQAVTTDVPAASIWMAKTFSISTVTYEVGDQTERTEIKRISEVAADELMRLLLAP